MRGEVLSPLVRRLGGAGIDDGHGCPGFQRDPRALTSPLLAHTSPLTDAPADTRDNANVKRVTIFGANLTQVSSASMLVSAYAPMSVWYVVCMCLLIDN